MGPGEYALERPGEPHDGHFGLAVTDYTHSTAPNRRFADLVTQRLVKAALGQRRARTRTTSSRRSPPTAPRRRTTHARWSGPRASRPRPLFLGDQIGQRVRRHRHRRGRQGDLRALAGPAGRGPRRPRRSGARRGRSRPGASRSDRAAQGLRRLRTHMMGEQAQVIGADGRGVAALSEWRHFPRAGA